MKHLDEQQLDEDIQERFNFLREFIGFNDDDIRLIQNSAPHIGPQIGDIVDRTYAKLLQYDATARHFLIRQEGFEGDFSTDLAELSGCHPQIQFRKDHLNRYVLSLIGRPFDAAFVRYLDAVGKMHTPHAGNRQIEIPLLQMNALMGLMSDLFIDVLMRSPLDDTGTLQTIRAFEKLFWIQNDFISRHYVA